MSSHHRSPSAASAASNNEQPSQTHHHSLIPTVLPTGGAVVGVAGGAHYSGSHVDPEPLKHRHSSHERSQTHMDLKADHHRVLEDIRELYELRPTPEIFERSWHKDAVFEDPLSKCKGFREYAAQAADCGNSLGLGHAQPKLFSKSETVTTRVMSSTRAPNRIVFSQTQRYQNRFTDKVGGWLVVLLIIRWQKIESIVTVDLDDTDKIIRLVDQWDGKALSWNFLRRLNAKVAPLFVNVPRRSV
ncbi:hypothetical protein C8R43DRAFT_1072814 [Mycena crocata]|nr:hypothetical protein C8R43DRAFT_1072814 [Mycena crocata]